ncbi:hypothetical protein IG631_22459 [Alternaria alternata]|nr:hypothetical protein IG631_22459 [Alternaria alternata]
MSRPKTESFRVYLGGFSQSWPGRQALCNVPFTARLGVITVSSGRGKVLLVIRECIPYMCVLYNALSQIRESPFGDQFCRIGCSFAPYDTPSICIHRTNIRHGRETVEFARHQYRHAKANWFNDPAIAQILCVAHLLQRLELDLE